jgi:hypothetical protein
MDSFGRFEKLDLTFLHLLSLLYSYFYLLVTIKMSFSNQLPESNYASSLVLDSEYDVLFTSLLKIGQTKDFFKWTKENDSEFMNWWMTTL